MTEGLATGSSAMHNALIESFVSQDGVAGEIASDTTNSFANLKTMRGGLVAAAARPAWTQMMQVASRAPMAERAQRARTGVYIETALVVLPTMLVDWPGLQSEMMSMDAKVPIMKLVWTVAVMPRMLLV